MSETQEVSKVVREMNFDDDTLRSISSFEDAVNLLAQEMGGELHYADEVLGDGFGDVIDNKDDLIGKPLVFLSWKFNLNGEFGEFVIARVVTADGQKMILTDGSTGIKKQLMDHTYQHNTHGGLIVRKGLRKSDYPMCKSCAKIMKNYGGEEGPHERPDGLAVCEDSHRVTGSTYYIDTSS